MPEAIATTKRKFYKALDALTASSQTSLHNVTSSTSSTSSAKRSSTAAFEEARERVRKRLRQSTSSSSLATPESHASIIALPARPTPRSNANANQAPPNYSPWSQETFLARLKTFSSVSLWHPKPESISEVVWAKRGWVCVDVNTVACKGGCGNRVVVSLGSTKGKTQHERPRDVDQDTDNDEDDEAASLEQALAERYKDVIANGHSLTCLWRNAGCKNDIYRLPVVRPSIWQPQLRQRFQTLKDISSSIQHVKTRPTESSEDRLLHDVPRDLLGLTDAPESSAGKPFQIAMHGWRGSSEAGNKLLHCDACFQRVGLWMYQPEHQKPSAALDSEADTDPDAGIIDLVEMHRDHCPWRNAETQDATGSLGGLNAIQILHRVVSTAVRDHRRRSMPQPAQLELDSDQERAEPTPVASREDIVRQDRERESRLRKLKSLFSIKRRPTSKSTAQKTA